MTEQEWTKRAEVDFQHYGVTWDSAEVYEAYMNAMPIISVDGRPFHQETYNEETLSIFICGLGSIIEGGNI